MTHTNDQPVRRLIGIIGLFLGLVYIWADFARAGDAAYANWQQWPLLAVIGGMLVTAGAVQFYWRPLDKLFALGWLYLFMSIGYIAIAAIDWKPGEYAVPPQLIIGLLMLVPMGGMFLAARHNAAQQPTA